MSPVMAMSVRSTTWQEGHAADSGTSTVLQEANESVNTVRKRKVILVLLFEIFMTL
jgi:hypothetical protein